MTGIFIRVAGYPLPLVNDILIGGFAVLQSRCPVNDIFLKK
jgi:hypothetical protein